MTGIFFAVVGKSGVGKDTLLVHAKTQLAQAEKYYFPTRTITMPFLSYGEKHNSISADDFLRNTREGKFCLWWEAHGYHYGLPNEINEKLQSGCNVLANISRRSVLGAAEKFDQIAVIEITLEAETIRKRLIGRGRESEREILNRQNREVDSDWRGALQVETICNDGEPAVATRRLVDKILALAASQTFEQA